MDLPSISSRCLVAGLHWFETVSSVGLFLHCRCFLFLQSRCVFCSQGMFSAGRVLLNGQNQLV